MRPSGPVAYGHARIRAWRSRLFSRMDVAPLIAAHDGNTVRRALATLSLDPDDLGRSLRERLFAIYATAIHAYRDAGPLLHSMLRLHEIENVKLVWRIVLRDVPRASFHRYWIDLEKLATLREEKMRDVATLHDAAAVLASTPYASIAAEVARAYADDLAAAEIAFDRWASRSVVEQVGRLSNEEKIARDLLSNVVRERDFEIASRGVKSYGLSESAVVAARAALDKRVIATDLRALRTERLRLCRRAFVGSPFSVAPAIATILLAEEEVRGVRALVERGGDESLDEPVSLALAAGMMGA